MDPRLSGTLGPRLSGTPGIEPPYPPASGQFNEVPTHGGMPSQITIDALAKGESMAALGKNNVSTTLPPGSERPIRPRPATLHLMPEHRQAGQCGSPPSVRQDLNLPASSRNVRSNIRDRRQLPQHERLQRLKKGLARYSDKPLDVEIQGVRFGHAVAARDPQFRILERHA